jgi:hypothetical protein
VLLDSVVVLCALRSALALAGVAGAALNRYNALIIDLAVSDVNPSTAC